MAPVEMEELLQHEAPPRASPFQFTKAIRLAALLLVGTALAVVVVVRPTFRLWATRSQSNGVVSLSVHSDEAAAKKFWDHATPQFQHTDRHYVSRIRKLTWDAFLPHYDWAGKSVLDYGPGGGYLGEYLFNTSHISSYTGVDISQKALDVAEKVLAPWKEKTTLLLTPQNFAALKPDILVCQEVIQHFPSVEYFEEWLKNANSSGATWMMVMFRESPDGKTTANGAYQQDANSKIVTFALVTETGFVKAHLTNYNLVWQEERPMCCNTVARFTGWRLKEPPQEMVTPGQQ